MEKDYVPIDFGGKNNARFQNCVIFGVKHCGKSSAGKCLAEKLDAAFYDTDDIIFEITGKTPRRIYAESGEAAFKSAEENACAWLRRTLKVDIPRSLVTAAIPAVIATGGGICCNPAAIENLNGAGLRVFIDADEKTVADRIIKKSEEAGSYPAYIEREHPQSLDDVRMIFHRFYRERREMYLRLADAVVRNGETPEQTAEKIRALLSV
ncbi:MAG: hypothetical protein NC041_00590 [Bacteroides sp.]|nr:hypothetical protein [Prevotella sp.]MCM1407974.1 hypothetical protein [Treponema brennaborense]MCM1468950.1 hypothetical protein [Bacteroides sp.]